MGESPSPGILAEFGRLLRRRLRLRLLRERRGWRQLNLWGGRVFRLRRRHRGGRRAFLRGVAHGHAVRAFMRDWSDDAGAGYIVRQLGEADKRHQSC